jgi:hypothetical protein
MPASRALRTDNPGAGRTGPEAILSVEEADRIGVFVACEQGQVRPM